MGGIHTADEITQITVDFRRLIGHSGYHQSG
jgi:hypothetical protein